MNITIIPASAAPQPIKRLKRVKKDMTKIVEQFINSDLSDAIISSSGPSVNQEIPIDAYSDLALFYKLCDEALSPLGYKSSESHDGGGMYNTLFVSWKK